MVDQVPAPPPLPPDPQAPAATETMPLLSVWRHLVPNPAKLDKESSEEVMLDELRLPILAMFARKLVVEASEETNKLVVVADVPVAFWKVRLWNVVEPLTKRFEKVANTADSEPMEPVLLRSSEVEAKDETKRFVEVELTVVAFVPRKLVLVKVVMVDDAPSTAFDIWAKTDEDNRCLGERVSNVVPFEDTSTCR